MPARGRRGYALLQISRWHLSSDRSLSLAHRKGFQFLTKSKGILTKLHRVCSFPVNLRPCQIISLLQAPLMQGALQLDILGGSSQQYNSIRGLKVCFLQLAASERDPSNRQLPSIDQYITKDIPLRHPQCKIQDLSRGANRLGNLIG